MWDLDGTLSSRTLWPFMAPDPACFLPWEVRDVRGGYGLKDPPCHFTDKEMDIQRGEMSRELGC